MLVIYWQLTLRGKAQWAIDAYPGCIGVTAKLGLTACGWMVPGTYDGDGNPIVGG